MFFLSKKKNNCIETSTAIGYCLEEFIVSKLIDFTNSNNEEDICILRDNGSTQNISYDCYSFFRNEKFLINIKAEKGTNNAISAIKQLYNDYVVVDKDIIKHFLVLKIHYDIRDRKIVIDDIDGYFIEEIDFSNGYCADKRNWSDNYKKVSARLEVSKSFYNLNRYIDDNLISYDKTYAQINNIFHGNIPKISKKTKK